jgi:hypothetical protein
VFRELLSLPPLLSSPSALGFSLGSLFFHRRLLFLMEMDIRCCEVSKKNL